MAGLVYPQNVSGANASQDPTKATLEGGLGSDYHGLALAGHLRHDKVIPCREVDIQCLFVASRIPACLTALLITGVPSTCSPSLLPLPLTALDEAYIWWEILARLPFLSSLSCKFFLT
jgi:hypothetical protein